VKEKLSQFCHVPVLKLSFSATDNVQLQLISPVNTEFCWLQAANIFTLYDVSNIWHIPLLLRVIAHFTMYAPVYLLPCALCDIFIFRSGPKST
jgi:hypothetical protein